MLKAWVEEWAEKDVQLGIENSRQVQHLYRSMDFLLKHEKVIQEKVFWSAAHLMNLTVDLIFLIPPIPILKWKIPVSLSFCPLANPSTKETIFPKLPLKENLHIKAVYAGEGCGRRRFIIAYNPEQAEHVKHVEKET